MSGEGLHRVHDLFIISVCADAPGLTPLSLTSPGQPTQRGVEVRGGARCGRKIVAAACSRHRGVAAVANECRHESAVRDAPRGGAVTWDAVLC